MFEVTSKASAAMVDAIKIRIRELSTESSDLTLQLQQILQVVDAFRVEEFGGLFVWPAGTECWHYLADGQEAWAAFQVLILDRQRLADDFSDALDALKRFCK